MLGCRILFFYLCEAMLSSVMLSRVRPCQLKSPCWGHAHRAHQKWWAVQQQEGWPQNSLFTSPVAWGKAGWRRMWEKSQGCHHLLRRKQWLTENKEFSSVPKAETLHSTFPPISPVPPGGPGCRRVAGGRTVLLTWWMMKLKPARASEFNVTWLCRVRLRAWVHSSSF